MRWLNPAALYGLLAVAVPILVHLFGRRVAKRQRFPTLRLLRDVKTTPVTRSTPSDLLLLLLRCAVIVVAVVGLAQPKFTDDHTGAGPVRVIVVDTSASMSRLTSTDTTARDKGRLLARQMMDSAREGLVIESANPGAALAGAASWLDHRSGLRELVVISDFQRGTVSDGDLASVPDDIGLQMVRVPFRRDTLARADTTWFGAVPMSVDSIGTGAAWIPPADTTMPVVILAPDRDRGRVEASMAAVMRAVPIRSTAIRRVAVVFPGFAGAMPPSNSRFVEPWQGDVLARLTRDQLILGASRDSSMRATCPSAGVPLLNADGDAIAGVAAGGQGSEPGLLVFACAAPGTLTGTAVLAATVRAFAAFPSLGEYETTELPDELLQSWNRAPRERLAPGTEETSPDGRWFWLLALLLLVTEEWIRRRTPPRSSIATTEERHARVA